MKSGIANVTRIPIFGKTESYLAFERTLKSNSKNIGTEILKLTTKDIWNSLDCSANRTGGEFPFSKFTIFHSNNVGTRSTKKVTIDSVARLAWKQIMSLLSLILSTWFTNFTDYIFLTMEMFLYNTCTHLFSEETNINFSRTCWEVEFQRKLKKYDKKMKRKFILQQKLGEKLKKKWCDILFEKSTNFRMFCI